MKIYSVQRSQQLALSLNDAWRFFSNPANLALLTPPSLNLRPISDVPALMYEGMLVTYRITPFAGIPVTWVTEITHVNEPFMFIDEQRFGPYRFWHHEHRFEEIANGIVLGDTVRYGLPLGILGRIAHALVVRRQIDAIFAFRERVLGQRFGSAAH
ncbi:MAG TPA: SRPBCC family protein [Acidobacteriota bacterium]|nr:SRPBCC family protein [Acidobacteriota bacterium]